MALADRARDSGDLTKAARLYAKVPPRDPRYAAALVQRANMLKDLGVFEPAREAYVAARAIAPNDADISLQLGHLHKLNGREDEAVDFYETAARLDPACEAAIVEAARIRLRQWDPEAAVDVNGGFAAVLKAVFASSVIRERLIQLIQQEAIPSESSDLAALQAAKALLSAALPLGAAHAEDLSRAPSWQAVLGVVAQMDAAGPILDEGWPHWRLELFGAPLDQGQVGEPEMSLGQGPANQVQAPLGHSHAIEPEVFPGREQADKPKDGGAAPPPEAPRRTAVQDGAWSINGRQVEGWLVANLTGRVEIEAWLDSAAAGRTQLTVTAGEFKAFSFPLPVGVADGVEHTVEVAVARNRDDRLRHNSGAFSVPFHRRVAHVVDGIDGGFISGWAFDVTDTDTSLEIELYDGPVLINRTITNHVRKDVNAQFSIQGAHGFMITIPAQQFDGLAHSLSLRAGGEPLHIDVAKRLPPILTPDMMQGRKGRFGGRVENLSTHFIAGWAADLLDPFRPVRLGIYVDGICSGTVIADGFQKRFQPVCGSGYHGFFYRFPAALMNNTRRTIEVRVLETGFALDFDGARNKSGQLYFPLIDFFSAFDVQEGSRAPSDLPLTNISAPPRAAPADAAPPSVSLIVLNWNGAGLLEVMLQSVVTHLSGNDIEVILVDHGSHDESLEVAESFRDRLDLKIIARGANYSFSASNNMAAREARGDHLFIVNNDIFFQGDCLRSMTGWLRDPDVGIVGMRLVEPLPTGRGEWRYAPHHRGVQFYPKVLTSGDAIYSPLELFDHYSDLGASFDLPAVTAAAFLCRKSDFLEIGGFDESYFYGLEDVDFCLRFGKALGKRIVCDGASSALHNRSFTRSARLTSGTANPITTNPKSQTDNVQVFSQRFKRQVIPQALASMIEGQTFWTTRRLRVVFAVTDAAYTTAAGDFFTAMELAEAMRALFGWEVMFVQQGVAELPGCDVLIVMRHDYNLGRVTGANPGLVTIAWIRNRVDQWVKSRHFQAYNLVFCSSNLAIEKVAELTGRTSHLLPIATNAKRFKAQPPVAEHKTEIVFTGSFWGHSRDAIELLGDGVPGQLAIYGYGWEEKEHWRQYWRGSVPYFELPKVYASADLVIDDSHPVTRDWNSLNSRIFDALGAGALVVTNNRGGAEELFPGLLPTFSSAEELKSLIEEHLSAPEARKALAKQLHEEVLANHTYDNRARALKDVLGAFVSGSQRFAIKIGVPNHNEKHAWGDWHFALGMQRALRRAGHEARIDILPEWYTGLSVSDDVVIVLRGLSAYTPSPSKVNLLWMISHPDDVPVSELDKYDHVFVASQLYAERLKGRLGDKVSALLQCTDPDLFHPEVDPAVEAADLLFVGNSRGVRRPIVDDAIKAGIDITVYGGMWEGILPASQVRGTYLPNEALRRHYSAAKVVFNDHWPDMKRDGFISNRIFDAGACGAAIVSDDVVGLKGLFGAAVTTYEGSEDLRVKVEALVADKAARRRKGKRLRETIIAGHTFDHRIADILAVVKAFS